MTPQEAKKIIKENGIKCRRLVTPDVLRVAVKALEKQIEIKPGGSRFVGKCVCGKTVYPHMLFCDECGQALDWGKE